MDKYKDFPHTINGQQAPFEIHGVTQTIFSIARFSGGCKAFGTEYVYDHSADILVRKDVLKAYKAKPQTSKE